MWCIHCLSRMIDENYFIKKFVTVVLLFSWLCNFIFSFLSSDFWDMCCPRIKPRIKLTRLVSILSCAPLLVLFPTSEWRKRIAKQEVETEAAKILCSFGLSLLLLLVACDERACSRFFLRASSLLLARFLLACKACCLLLWLASSSSWSHQKTSGEQHHLQHQLSGEEEEASPETKPETPRQTKSQTPKGK